MKTLETIKVMRAAAREQVPLGSIRSKVVPMKRKAKLEKILKKEARDY